MTDEAPTISRPCNNCGRCCTNPNYMLSLHASGEDVNRWRREKRWDILRFVAVLGPRDDPWGDLWIDQEARNIALEERPRCPFVRKVPNQPRYLCRIYETRPQVCRDYVPWAPGNLCVEIEEPLK